MYLLMEETEKQAVRRALLEERGRYCNFITMLLPVVVRQGEGEWEGEREGEDKREGKRKRVRVREGRNVVKDSKGKMTKRLSERGERYRESEGEEEGNVANRRNERECV